MLTIFSQGRSRYCDGVSRRGFLKIGGLALGATTLSLADLFRLEAKGATAPSKRHKAVIHVFLGGGPPHQDMWDLKTEAPVEIRGEFKPIATNVPGIEIGECFPRIAQIADKSVFIRSVVGITDRHEAFQCNTGWQESDLRGIGGRPSVGAAVAKLQGQIDPSVPAFVGLAAPTSHRPWSDPGAVGFLGPTFAPFQPDGPALDNMKLKGMTLEQLGDRKKLLSSFDGLRRDADVNGLIAGADKDTAQAFDVLTSSKLLEALDLSKEDPRIRERYGDGKPYKFQYDGAPTANEQLLIARRLVQAGARVVTMSYGRWDSHGDNFNLVRDHGGKLDQCMSALVEDLAAHDMLDDTTVIAWGEFGRSPRINPQAGRDHWSPVSCAYLVGGGLRGGQVIGSTNRLGEHAKDRPVHFQEVVATLYHNLGLDPTTTTINDPTGRPQYLSERGPLRELI
jgi:hypothetical protein